MKWKTIVITAILTIFAVLLFFSGCAGRMDTAAASRISALPFTVPKQFVYNAEATEQNELLTFLSESGTTLIISHSQTAGNYLEQAMAKEITEASLVRSYKNAGLDVSITNLQVEKQKDSLTYTFSVHLSTRHGSTVTRKYIHLTKQEALDLSCGGNVADEDTIDLDYGALLQAVAG